MVPPSRTPCRTFQDIIEPMTEVKSVIELNAGITAKLGIGSGDKVDECDDRDEKVGARFNLFLRVGDYRL